MNRKKLPLLLFFIGSILLTSGCEKQEPITEPETIADFFMPPEEVQTEINTIPESEATPPEEAASESLPEQASTAEQPSPQEPMSQNTAVPDTESAVSDDFITVSNEFYGSDTWISRISFQIPKDWSYRIDEDPSDWGFWVDIPDQKNFTLHIHALPGTFNVENFYTVTPTDFVTTSGMKGKFYQEKSAGDDGIPYIEGDIVFDQTSSGISFLAYEDIYDEYMDTLQKIFLSVTIEDIYTE